MEPSQVSEQTGLHHFEFQVGLVVVVGAPDVEPVPLERIARGPGSRLRRSIIRSSKPSGMPGRVAPRVDGATAYTPMLTV